MTSLEKIIKYLLLAAAVAPLIYAPSLLFPFITGKVLFFRLIVGVATVLFLWLLAYSPEKRAKLFQFLKRPLTVLVLLFFLSLTASSILAVSPYLAFWGNLERGEGLLTMLHFLAFFLISTTVFSKNNWRTFVKLSLIVSLVIAFYGILQSAGIKWFPGSFNIIRFRPWSTLGNSSFVGGYFVMILGLAWWLTSLSSSGLTGGSTVLDSRLRGNNRGFWYYFSLFTAVVATVMIFLSASRGAMLALLVGVVIWVGYKVCNALLMPSSSLVGESTVLGSRENGNGKGVSGNHKKIYLTISVVLILLVSGFLATKNQPFWQKIPGFDRLAGFSLDHPTVQTRLLSLGTSWEAFKERPIFGWGPENFLVAYNKHYNPRYALYEAAWFDRAHNKLADIWVMQGLVGLLVYLMLFGYLGWHLIRKKQLALLAFFGMYFIQNLFVFDHPTSYLLFFAVLGIVTIPPSSAKAEDSALDFRFRGNGKTKENRLFSIIAIITTILFIYSAYTYHYVVYKQSKLFLFTTQTVADVSLFSNKADDFLVPYNYGQSTVRSQLMDFLTNQNVFESQKPVFVELGDKALAALEEHVYKRGVDPRNYIRLSEAYNDRAKHDPAYFQKAEKVLKQALELAPKRQEVYYHLAFTLAGAGKKKEAEEAAKQAVALAPEVARAHYILGVILSLTGDGLAGEAAIEKALKMNKGLFLMRGDPQNIVEIYSHNFLYYVKRRDIAGIQRAAERIKQFQPAAASAIDKLVKLAKEKKWGKLDWEIDKIKEKGEALRKGE